MQRGLVVAQVSLSVVLLTGAGLLVRTLLNLYSVDVGADLEGVLTVEVPLAGAGGRTTPEVREAYELMRSQIAALPGVTDAGVGSSVPLRENDFELEIKAEGVAVDPDVPTPRAEYRTATPDYFRAAGIPLIAGREFEPTDQSDAALVVIVNEALAEQMFPGRDPIGQRVAWTGEVLAFAAVSGDWRTIVGVVGNTRSASLDAEPPAALYQPFEQEQVFAGSLVVRSNADPGALLIPATQVVRQVDPSVPIGKVGTLAELRDESVASQRINALLVSGFGAVALLIAAVGLAGVLGFSVSQRINEIGVRMSLGAHPSQVRRMIVLEGATLLAIGLVLGAVASVFASGVVEGMLFNVAPNDPTTIIAVAALMGLVGVLAAWVPAVRASNVQPVEALRQE
jgi:predicted permease